MNLVFHISEDGSEIFIFPIHVCPNQETLLWKNALFKKNMLPQQIPIYFQIASYRCFTRDIQRVGIETRAKALMTSVIQPDTLYFGAL